MPQRSAVEAPGYDLGAGDALRRARRGVRDEEVLGLNRERLAGHSPLVRGVIRLIAEGRYFFDRLVNEHIPRGAAWVDDHTPDSLK